MEEAPRPPKSFTSKYSIFYHSYLSFPIGLLPMYIKSYIYIYIHIELSAHYLVSKKRCDVVVSTVTYPYSAILIAISIKSFYYIIYS